jgi:hypothetical protein
MWLEDGVDVTSRPAGIVGESHSCTTEDVKVGYNSPLGQPFPEAPKGGLNHAPIEQYVIRIHATSNSCRAT